MGARSDGLLLDCSALSAADSVLAAQATENLALDWILRPTWLPMLQGLPGDQSAVLPSSNETWMQFQKRERCSGLARGALRSKDVEGQLVLKTLLLTAAFAVLGAPLFFLSLPANDCSGTLAHHWIAIALPFRSLSDPAAPFLFLACDEN